MQDRGAGPSLQARSRGGNPKARSRSRFRTRTRCVSVRGCQVGHGMGIGEGASGCVQPGGVRDAFWVFRDRPRLIISRS